MVPLYQTTWCHIFEDHNLDILGLENIKYYIVLCRCSLTFAVVMFQKVWHKSDLVCMWSTLYFCTGATVSVQTSTHWNLIGHSKSTLLPVLLPISVLPAPLSQRSFNSYEIKLGRLFRNVISLPFFYYFLLFLKIA